MQTALPIAALRKRPTELVALASLLLFQLAIGVYGIAQPVRWGHFSHHIGEHGLAARNIERFGVFTHTVHSGFTAPPDFTLVFHHPLMLGVPVFLAQSVLGDGKPWVLRGVALFMCLVALGAIYAFTRRARGAPEAVATSLAFALIPVNVAFACLPDVQIFAIGATFLTGLAWCRLFERPSLGRALALMAAVGWAVAWDWPCYPMAFLVFLTGAVALRPGTPLAERLGARRLRTARLAMVGFCAVVLAVIAQHFARAYFFHRLDDMLHASSDRSSTSLADFRPIAERYLKQHIGLVPLAGGVVWLVTLPFRKPNAAVVYVACVLASQILWMLVFRTEFAFHEYRSYWLAAPLAFALGDVGCAVVRGVVTRVRGRRPTSLTVALAVSSAVFVALAPPAWHIAILSRERAGCTTMGSYIGSPATRDTVPLYAAAWLVGQTLGPNAVVFHTPGIPVDRPELPWLLRGRSEATNGPAGLTRAPRGSRVVVFGRVDTMREGQWHELLRRSRVAIIDGFVIARVDEAPSVESLTFRPGEPYGPLAAYLHAPVRAPALVAPGEVFIAMNFASVINAPAEVVAATLANRRPFFDAIPRELRAPAR